VAFHFSNDVFRQNFTFESTERILYGFALLQSNFCHAAPLTPNHRDPGLLLATFNTVSLPVTASIPAKPGKYELLANVIAGSRLLLSVRFIRAKIESLPALQRAGAVQPSRPRCPQRPSLASVDSFALLCPVVSAAACVLFGAL